MTDIKYKGWSISYWSKPIPDRRCDWDAVHEDYDGTNHLCFFAPTLEAAKQEIDEWDFDE